MAPRRQVEPGTHPAVQGLGQVVLRRLRLHCGGMGQGYDEQRLQRLLRLRSSYRARGLGVRRTIRIEGGPVGGWMGSGNLASLRERWRARAGAC